MYEPQYALNDDGTDYISILPEGTPQTRPRKPMPIAITFFANQGDEPVLIRAGTASPGEAVMLHDERLNPAPAAGAVPEESAVVATE